MKNYVSKINDRNLQRKRESGLTTYALYSILIIIFYNLTKIYPLIPIKKKYWEVLTVIIPTFNIYLGILIIIMVYSSTTNHISSIRVKLNSTNNNLLDEIILCSIILIPLSASLTVTIHEYNSLSITNWYLIIMSILLLLFTFIIIGIISSERKKVNKSIEIYEGTGNRADDKNWLSIFFYVLGFSIIIYSGFNLLLNTTNIGKLNVLIFGILIYSIPCLVIKILDLREKDNFTSALENLEYEINVNKLNDDEIRIRLQQNYFGFLLNDWIIYNFQLIEDFNLNIDEQRSNLDITKTELKNIDIKQYPIEHVGRTTKIKETEVSIAKQINSFYNQKIKEIESFWYDSEIEYADRMELYKLHFKFNEEFQKHKK
ncbi:hypothetical protein [Flavobacterium sp.]|uniref:hypothetical protein n=1 Tax=Flavobacterium sp. TaxID=239 RepID=UPI0037518357